MNTMTQYPEPTEEAPTIEELEEWMDDGVCEATDGCCPIELDGFCKHGYPSWLLQMGMI